MTKKTQCEATVEAIAVMREGMKRIDEEFHKITLALAPVENPVVQNASFHMDARYREFNFWAQMTASAGMQDAQVSAAISAAAATRKPKEGAPLQVVK
jgi:hypothetical protein